MVDSERASGVVRLLSRQKLVPSDVQLYRSAASAMGRAGCRRRRVEFYRGQERR